MIAKVWRWLVETLASRMLFRRLILVSAIGYFGILGWRVMAPEILLVIQPPGAMLAGSVFALLSAVIGLYQYMRSKDDD